MQVAGCDRGGYAGDVAGMDDTGGNEGMDGVALVR
jgi:hypothetical protein